MVQAKSMGYRSFGKEPRPRAKDHGSFALGKAESRIVFDAKAETTGVSPLLT
jgi:hypothetical protein